MKTLQVIIPLLAVAFAGCVGPDRPPHAVLPPVSEEYFVCEKCGSLHGGIYGKGPLVSLASTDASKCWHNWHQIPLVEFQKIAAQRFPAEWEKAGDFVKRTPKGNGFRFDVQQKRSSRDRAARPGMVHR